MKKKDFVTLLMSVIGGLLFALGMCMALIPEWEAMPQGIVVGAVGAAVLLIMVLVRRKMDGKPAIVFHGKIIAITIFGVIATGIFGVGMCMVMVWNIMVWGIVVGLVGLVLLLCLVPICKGLE